MDEHERVNPEVIADYTRKVYKNPDKALDELGDIYNSGERAEILEGVVQNMIRRMEEGEITERRIKNTIEKIDEHFEQTGEVNKVIDMIVSKAIYEQDTSLALKKLAVDYAEYLALDRQGRIVDEQGNIMPDSFYPEPDKPSTKAGNAEIEQDRDKDKGESRGRD